MAYDTKMPLIARTPKQIGEIIRRYRRMRKLTQGALANFVNVRQATISKLESGEPSKHLDTLMAILSELDLEIVIRTRSKSSTDDTEEMF